MKTSVLKSAQPEFQFHSDKILLIHHFVMVQHPQHEPRNEIQLDLFSDFTPSDIDPTLRSIVKKAHNCWGRGH